MIRKYEAIAATVRERIVGGTYAETLPSERALATEFATTAVTVRRALEELVQEGLIVREVGRGTRIRQEALNPVRLCVGLSGIGPMLMDALGEAFPDTQFRLQPLGRDLFDPPADITLLSTTFLGAYERHFTPLPADLVQRLRNDAESSSEMLDVHRSNGLFYGVPLLHSPAAMQVNTRLLDDIGEPLPTVPDVPTLKRLKAALDRHPRRPRLFDPERFHTVVAMQFFFAQLPANDDLDADDWRRLGEQAVTDFLAVVDGENRGGFATGEALFRITCRQSLVSDLASGDLPPEWDLVPLFHYGTPTGPVFSESLLVNREAANPDRLFDIASFAANRSLQRRIARTRHGIPVHKAAAFESFQADIHPAELLFMRELRHCRYRLPPVLRRLRGAIWTACDEYLAGQLDPHGVRTLILDTLASLLRDEQIRKRFEQRHVQYVLDAAIV